MQTSKDELTLPKLYHDLLRDFVCSVFEEKPEDLVDYAAVYFQNINNTESLKTRYVMKTKEASFDDEGDLEERPVIKSRGRRQAVAAQSYDPTAEDDTELVFHEKTSQQLEKLQNDVKGILLFKSIDSVQLKAVLGAMFERVVKEGEIVIRQGDDGDNFYVISEGKYDIFIKDGRNDKLVAQLDGKGSFGELALMYNCPRAATIIAKSPGKLWCLDQAAFRKIIVTAQAKKRKLFEDLLENVPMLSELTPYERMNLADSLDTQKFENGDRIIKEGDEAHNMFFIMEGTVRVTILDKSDGSEEKEVLRQHAGEYFGELALVTKKPRAACVYAVDAVTVAVLDSGAFERLLGPCVDIMKRNFDNYEKVRKNLGIETK